MRTTISLPDELYAEARELAGERPFSEFAGDAIRQRVSQLKKARLAYEMEQGYQAEAESPSLDAEWSHVEVDGF